MYKVVRTRGAKAPFQARNAPVVQQAKILQAARRGVSVERRPAYLGDAGPTGPCGGFVFHLIDIGFLQLTVSLHRGGWFSQAGTQEGGEL